MTISSIDRSEMRYSYRDDPEENLRAGCVGFMLADMGRSGTEFWSSWTDMLPELNTPAFKSDFNKVVNDLRKSRGEDRFLGSRKALGKFCYGKALGLSDTCFGAKVVTDKYVYVFRLNPTPGDYNVYCFCYYRPLYEARVFLGMSL